MKVGIPKGLLYYKYIFFIKKFLEELGVEIIISEDTNKEILKLGLNYCVDEACLPIKVFHGHVASIKDQCDIIIIPRIMRIRDSEFICPKFCGLPEMVANNIPNMPEITYEPLYINSKSKLFKWCKKLGYKITKNKKKIKSAFDKALNEQKKLITGINDDSYDFKVLLVGHPYNIYDSYINMKLVSKLKQLGVGVITEEFIDDVNKDEQINELYKKPFWTFFRNNYGACMYLAKKCEIDGIIYISSFACGIDSINIELIRGKLKKIPFLVLKVDEQTGEAGFNTRIEAFVDMLYYSQMSECALKSCK